MKRKLPVSLVIPCYNRLAQTRNLLLSIEESEFNCEIILVDDASTEDIKNLINEFPVLNINYRRLSVNKGPAYARNVGISMSSHEFVAFTDNDCQVEKSWLIRLYEYISNTSVKVAGVGGKVIGLKNDLYSQYYTYHKILDPWFYQGRYYYLVTANAIFKKSCLKEADGFDESIKLAGGEDPGLCFKLLSKGYELLYCPEAIIRHDYKRGIKQLFRMFYRYGYGCSKQWRTHFGEKRFNPNTGYGGIDIQVPEVAMDVKSNVNILTYIDNKPNKE